MEDAGSSPVKGASLIRMCLKCNASFNTNKSIQMYCSSVCNKRAVQKRARQRRLKGKYVDGVHYKSLAVMEMTIQEYCDKRDKADCLIKKDSFRFYARAWNKDLIGLACEECGYDKHTEFCHIKAVKDFPPETKLKVVHARENIKILCPNCHWEFDNLPRS